MTRSATAAIRENTWRTVSGGVPAALATLAVAGDVLTTARILYSPDYWEGNVLLSRLAEIDPAVALAVFLGYCSIYLAVAWLSFGWLSTATALVVAVSMGGGAINNLVLFATGIAIYPRVGVDHAVAIHFVKPALGFGLGVAIARRRGPLPGREVAAVAALVGLAAIVALVA